MGDQAVASLYALGDCSAQTPPLRALMVAERAPNRQLRKGGERATRAVYAPLGLLAALAVMLPG